MNYIIAKLCSKYISRIDDIYKVFYSCTSTPKESRKLGKECYSIRKKYLDKHRFNTFKIDHWSKASPNLSASNERLCPATLAQSSFTGTEMAGKSITTDYLGLDDACQWTAQPLTTQEPAAPAAILTTTFCSCTKGCGYRKAGNSSVRKLPGSVCTNPVACIQRCNERRRLCRLNLHGPLH